MANFLSQDEIDNMLSQVNNNSEISGFETAAETAESGEEYEVKKVYKHRRPPIQRHADDYRSPVIKAEDVIYNPAPEAAEDMYKNVVYTLNAFAQKK